MSCTWRLQVSVLLSYLDLLDYFLCVDSFWLQKRTQFMRSSQFLSSIVWRSILCSHALCFYPGRRECWTLWLSGYNGSAELEGKYKKGRKLLLWKWHFCDSYVFVHGKMTKDWHCLAPGSLRRTRLLGIRMTHQHLLCSRQQNSWERNKIGMWMRQWRRVKSGWTWSWNAARTCWFKWPLPMPLLGYKVLMYQRLRRTRKTYTSCLHWSI